MIRLDHAERLSDVDLIARLNEYASNGEYESYEYLSVLELKLWIGCLIEYTIRREQGAIRGYE